MKPPIHSCLSLVVTMIGAAALWLGPAGRAATFQWTNTTAAAFVDAANWTNTASPFGNGVPGAADTGINGILGSTATIGAADNVAAGQKGVLNFSKLPAGSARSGANGLLREISYAAHAEALSGSAGNYLLPNTYIAVLDGNPFIENALGSSSSSKRTKSSAVVFGILEANGKN